jgi:hypothetical protein
MLDGKLIYSARWNELYAFFAAGNPPLVLVLLALNTAFLVYFIIRRIRSKHPTRPTTAYMLQGLLIASNFIVMFQKDITGSFYWLKTLV